MKQPVGFDDGSGKVCRLQRSLYGLKQAPRCWNKRFTDVLEGYGLQQSKADPCLYVHNRSESKLIVALYVDDGLVASNCPGKLSEFLAELETKFKMTTKPLSFFLGIQIERGEDGSVFIHQGKYVEAILERFKMNNAAPVTTPMDRGALTGHSSESPENDESKYPYREVVGSLIYLAKGTRPDIAFAVGYASRFLDKFRGPEIAVVKRVFEVFERDC